MNIIKAAFHSCGKIIKSVVKSVTDVVKNVIQHTADLVKAIASGDPKEIAKCTANLAMDMVDVATLPEGAVAAGVITAAQETLKNGAKALGMDNKPWMKKSLDALTLGSNFTSFGKAGRFVAEEATAIGTGQPSQLETYFKKHGTDDGYDSGSDNPQSDASGTTQDDTGATIGGASSGTQNDPTVH